MKTETKRAEKPISLKASEILERLKTTQDKLAALQERRKLAALESINGNTSNELATVKTEIAATLAEIEDLQAAHAGAVLAAQREERAAYATQHASQIRSCRAHLSARQKAAEALTAALEEAVKQWKILIEQSVKARASVVIGQWPNSQVFVDFASINRLLEGEIFRIGGDGSIAPKSFPGARCQDHHFLNQPGAVRPMAETLAEASDHLLKVLQGKDS